MELAMTLKTVEVNSRINPQAFDRNELPYKSFDLARWTPDAGATSIQKVRGSQP
jgi:hypothetical protein